MNQIWVDRTLIIILVIGLIVLAVEANEHLNEWHKIDYRLIFMIVNGPTAQANGTLDWMMIGKKLTTDICCCCIDYYCYTRHSEVPAQRDKVITSRSNYLAPVARF